VDLGEVLGAYLVEAVAPDDARVVDQTVDLAVRGAQLGGQVGPLRLAADVEAPAVALRPYVGGVTVAPARVSAAASAAP
jgi:hypothetical protein